MAYSSAQTIRVVAEREISVALRNKGIMITLAIFLVGIIGFVAFVAWKAGSSEEDQAPTLVVVGMPEGQLEPYFPAESTGSPVPGMGGPSNKPLDISYAPSREDAERQVRDEGKDAALIARDQGYDLLSEGTADPVITEKVTIAVNGLAQTQALQKVGVQPEVFARALPNATVATVDLEREDASEENFAAVMATLLGLAVVMMMVILFAANVGSRVTEEKSSRVVEIILASARPMDFLTGKLLGNTIFSLAASAILIGVGAAGVAVAGGLDELPSTINASLVPVLLSTMVLAMLCFSALYAAAGSLVSRTEDLQSSQTPVLLLMMLTMYIPAFTWTKLDSPILQVLAWIPPFSYTMAPLQLAQGNLSWWEFLVITVLGIIAVVAVLALVARIYRNSILRNGQKVAWLAAIRG